MHPKLAAALLFLAFSAIAPAGAAACPRIWLVGDSQTALYGSRPGVGLIAQHPEWCVQNLALGGETSAGALTRIGQYLADHPDEHPDVVVMLYGENDRVQAYLETIGNDPACMNAMLSCPLSPASFWHPDPAGERILDLAALIEAHGVGEILLGLPVEGAHIARSQAPDHIWQTYRWLKTWALDLRKDTLRSDYRTVNFRLTRASEFRPGDPFHQSDAGITKQVRKAARGIAASLRRQRIR